MSTVKTVYGSDGVAVTCTLASLAAGSARESNTVDNTSNLYLDALVQVTIKLTTGTAGSDKAVYVYVWGTADYTTTATYPDAVTGSDAAITLQSPTQLRLLARIEAPAQSTTYTHAPASVAACFGGILPAKWGVVVSNASNIALTGTAGDHQIVYQGIQTQIV